MMREILFRGKRVDNGEWVYGSLIKRNIGSFIVDENNNCSLRSCAEFDFSFDSKLVIPETVGQYTGLTDKNGKKIFEGDICRFREWNNGDMCWVGRVHYEHQQFVISGNKNKECETPFTLTMSRFISKNIEVIGNIHDNPELLEVDNG